MFLLYSEDLYWITRIRLKEEMSWPSILAGVGDGDHDSFYHLPQFAFCFLGASQFRDYVITVIPAPWSQLTKLYQVNRPGKHVTRSESHTLNKDQRIASVRSKQGDLDSSIVKEKSRSFLSLSLSLSLSWIDGSSSRHNRRDCIFVER